MRLYPLLIAVLFVSSACQDAEIIGPSPLDTLPAPNLEPNGSFEADRWRYTGGSIWMQLRRLGINYFGGGVWVPTPVHQDACEVDGVLGIRRYYVLSPRLELLADRGRFTLSYDIEDKFLLRDSLDHWRAHEQDTTEFLVSGVLAVSGEGLATELTLVPDDPSQSSIHGYVDRDRCYEDGRRAGTHRWVVDLELSKCNGLVFKFSLGFPIVGGPYRCI